MSKSAERAHVGPESGPPVPAPRAPQQPNPRHHDPLAAQPSGLQVSQLEIDGVVYQVLSHPLTSEPAGAPNDPLSALFGAKLTATDRDIAEQILAGRSHMEVASARGTSPRTVGKQVQLIYRKLGVQSRAELAALVATPPQPP